MSDIRLWHGDSRELAANIPDKSIKCLILDPPYGKNFRSHRATTPQGMKHTHLIEGDASPEQAIWLFAEVMQALEPKVAVECDAYLFTSWDLVDTWIEVARSMTAHQFIYKMLLIWEKGYPGQGDIDGNWGCGHEEILYLKKGRRDMPYRRSGVIHVNKLSAKKHIHPCLPPDEMVRTEAGFRPIAEVAVGDRVYGHDGHFHVVTNTYERHANDGLVRVTAAGHSEPTTTTGNHPWLIWRPERRGHAVSGGVVDWVPAEQVQKGDYTLTPRAACPETGGPDVDWAWAAGLWLAQGSFLRAGHGVARYPRYAIHEGKLDLERMRRAFSGNSIASYPRAGDRAVTVDVFNRDTGERFFELFGKGSHEKSISPEVWAWGTAARQALLDGYVDGDGWRRDREVRIKTVSDDLAAGVALLAESLGSNVSMWHREPSDARPTIQGRVVNASPWWDIEIVPQPPIQRRPRAMRWKGQEYTLRYVKSVEHLQYDGPVWNLTVEGAHTFQTYAGMTHNTEKPVQLMEELIRISTEPGDLVVDPFAGSASSLVAARNLGRNAIGMELSSEYVRLAQERLAEGVLL